MDFDEKTPKPENLQNLTYSELRKVASKFGIKGKRMKSGKLIAAILSKTSDDDEIFSTPAAKEINSSRKNKEKKFDEDQMTPLATPRRGTYSIDTPSSVKVEDVSSVSLVVNASDLDLSNVTLGRGSERKLRSRKVSFMSPAITPRTPKSQKLRNRPKTPIASRTPLNESVSSSGLHKRKSTEDSFHWPASDVKTAKLEIDFDVKSNAVSAPSNSTPLPVSIQNVKEDVKTPRTRVSFQNVKSSITKENAKQLSVKKKGITPSGKNVETREPTSIKRVATPNFSRVHQKAFEKMESIIDYQKRKLMNSAKKLNEHKNLKSKMTVKAQVKRKIPGCSGIPFIPSVSASASMKPFTKGNKLVPSVGKSKIGKENTPQSLKKNINITAKNIVQKHTPRPNITAKNIVKKDTPRPNITAKNIVKKDTPRPKSKFDLQASLSRKLGYKPYKGPLKPLTNSLEAPIPVKAEKPVNKLVTKKRLQTRSVIKGVRMNKRFELQMKNRKLE